MGKKEKKTLGTAIDDIVSALEALEPNARTTAVTAACAHLRISTGTGPPSDSGQFDTRGQPPADHVVAPAPSPSKVTDIKTFKDDKKPRSATEMACVVAYYLLELLPHGERKDKMTTKDIERYFKQAKFPLPKVLRQVLRNAKAGGYFDSVGTGAYKLNPVGYNLVAHTLPRKK